MFEDIKNKRVLITGSTGGMGIAIAMLFAEYGARIGLHYQKNRTGAQRLQKKLWEIGAEAEIFQADLLRTQASKNLVKSFIKKCGGIDILINNAGAVYDYENFKTLSETSWERTFDLNTKAPFYLSGEVFDSMKNHGGGKIINISSANAAYGGSAKSMHYVASKTALESITRGFANVGAVHNVLVNAIRCGVIDTGMNIKVGGYTKKDFLKRISMIPLKRAGTPLDIARMALFLTSEAGNFITGETFTVAGGD